MVVFTCDNGSAVFGTLGDFEYEKRKGRVVDLGVHVPLVVDAPFLTAGGRASRDLIDFTDFYPTFLELTGMQVPEFLNRPFWMANALFPVCVAARTRSRNVVGSIRSTVMFA